MKNLLVLLTILLTLSCKDDGVRYNCVKGTIRVLNKKVYIVFKAQDIYQMYLYDGTQAYWCETDKTTYQSYQINDTLPTLVIIKTYEKKTN